MAAPAGPEGPSNCTFEKGTTTCSHVGDPVVTTSTSSPDPTTGCKTTTTTTTITTSYSAHRGTYNSHGKQLADPPSTSTESSTSSEECPPPPPANSAKAACEALGYNYNEPGGDFIQNGYHHGELYYTCGDGNDLTIAQAWAIAWTPVHSQHCVVSRDGWGTVNAPGYPASFPATGWYYVCFDGILF